MKWTARILIVAALFAVFGMALAQPGGAVTATASDTVTPGGNEWG